MITTIPGSQSLAWLWYCDSYPRLLSCGSLAWRLRGCEASSAYKNYAIALGIYNLCKGLVIEPSCSIYFRKNHQVRKAQSLCKKHTVQAHLPHFGMQAHATHLATFCTFPKDGSSLTSPIGHITDT